MRLPEDAARALEKLESAGWESYAVGGCVRDSLLGIEPHDWDLCTAAPPEAMKKVFAMFIPSLAKPNSCSSLPATPIATT